MSLELKPRPEKKGRTIVFVTFESEFAPLGGLAAVMRALPREMAGTGSEDCILIAPFFREITRCKESLYKRIQRTGLSPKVRFGGRTYDVEIWLHTDDSGFQSFLIYSPDFFQAPCDCSDPSNPRSPCNPYFNPSKPEGLLDDALFFCAAVPEVLTAIGRIRNLVLNLQDWQTANVVFTIREKNEIVSAACVLTLHNPYDAPIDDSDFRKISGESTWGATVLTRALPYIEGPLNTVSEIFAKELTEETLHNAVYAPHLQDLFRTKRLLGINNGLFAKPDFPPSAIESAEEEDVQPLLDEKRRRRRELEQALLQKEIKGSWGRLDLSGFPGPIFFMFGRDDPRQKGYDVLAAAIRETEPGKAMYIFTPMPGDEGTDGLRFLRDLALRERPGEILVLPFRIESDLYKNLQQGSSFLVMPSFYEPFGGATEGYAVGTPVLARATGGLIQQVAPFTCASLSRAARELAVAFHGRSAPATGFLFREPWMPAGETSADWRSILSCEYRDQMPDGDRLKSRMNIRLFSSMAREAAWTLQDATKLYTEQQQAYGKMMFNGFKMLEAFSWDYTVREYQRVYDQVCNTF
ncbi:MAG: glycogen/starch synthase [Deltaproteobacteria bacterium]|nr:glycogen/starch synthase [Deltaproteobacteria bacterium]